MYPSAEILNDSLSDDFMNLVEVAIKLNSEDSTATTEDDKQILAVTFMNQHCYVPCIAGDQPKIRPSVQLKIKQLESMKGWKVIIVD